jgi:hypothetical protein
MNSPQNRPTWQISRVLATLLPLLLMMGCATDDANRDTRFGQSVRHMLAVQTANPDANARGFDGQKAALSLQQYRKDVAKPQQVDKQELGVVAVGGSGG